MRSKTKKNHSDSVMSNIPQLKTSAARRQLVELQSEATQASLRVLTESEISVRLQIIDEEYKTFNQFQTIIEEENPMEIETDARSDFRRLYISVKSTYAEELNSRTKVRCSSPIALKDDHTVPISFATQRTRLPAIHLPSFSGNHVDWPDFYSTFQSMIHN